MKLHGYIEIAEGLDGAFRDYCESHNLIYKSVDDDGLYRVEGSILSTMKFAHRISKMHKEYFKKVEA